MTTNLFDGNQDETPVLDPNKKYFEELVGEGRKFSDPEDLAKGKAHSDALIAIYEKKMDQMRSDISRQSEELRAGATLKAYIDQIDARKQQLASSEQPLAKEDEKPVFDPNQLKSLISEEVTSIEKNRKENENFNLVKAKLQERHGDNYAAALKQTVESLGLTIEEANAMAKRSPQAFMRTFGLDQAPGQEGFQSPPRSQRDGFVPKGTPKRTWAWYQEQYKKNPSLYYDRKTNIQMQKDIIELGEEFKDGDFHALGP